MLSASSFQQLWKHPNTRRAHTWTVEIRGEWNKRKSHSETQRFTSFQLVWLKNLKGNKKIEHFIVQESHISWSHRISITSHGRVFFLPQNQTGQMKLLLVTGCSSILFMLQQIVLQRWKSVLTEKEKPVLLSVSCLVVLQKPPSSSAETFSQWFGQHQGLKAPLLLHQSQLLSPSEALGLLE